MLCEVFVVSRCLLHSAVLDEKGKPVLDEKGKEVKDWPRMERLDSPDEPDSPQELVRRLFQFVSKQLLHTNCVQVHLLLFGCYSQKYFEPFRQKLLGSSEQIGSEALERVHA